MQTNQVQIENLPISTVDPHSPIPLYYQIYLDLKGMIDGGVLTHGALLPAEMEICSAYGVGRQTVRQTIARLVDENLVERYAGRGTFVKSQSERMKFYLDRSFTQQIIELGYRPYSKLICKSTDIITASYPEHLATYRGATCLNLERLRFADDIPISYQATTVLTTRCPGLEQYDFSVNSLYNILASEYRLIIQRIDYLVRALAADEYRAEMLEIEPGNPLLFVGTSAFLDNDVLIETTTSYYRADLYEYSTSHHNIQR